MGLMDYIRASYGAKCAHRPGMMRCCELSWTLTILGGAWSCLFFSCLYSLFFLCTATAQAPSVAYTPTPLHQPVLHLGVPCCLVPRTKMLYSTPFHSPRTEAVTVLDCLFGFYCWCVRALAPCTTLPVLPHAARAAHVACVCFVLVQLPSALVHVRAAACVRRN